MALTPEQQGQAARPGRRRGTRARALVAVSLMSLLGSFAVTGTAAAVPTRRKTFVQRRQASVVSHQAFIVASVHSPLTGRTSIETCHDLGPAITSDNRRPLKVRVKSGKGRTLSSKLWLERQLNDPYVERARKEGYRSRAAFKLKEIDERYKLLKHGQAVVDLGAAPGGWSQIAAARVGSLAGKGKVVAIDLLEIDELPGVAFQQMDFLEEDAPERLRAMLGGGADFVMSDMAPNTTGHRKTDQLRIVGLVETAAAFAREVLNPGGAFLAKVLRGGTENELLNTMKRDFRTVRHVKPPASRADSAESYVIATGFRG